MIRGFLCLSMLLFSGVGWGAELSVGKWSGSYCFAEDDPLQVDFQVERKLSEQEPPVVSWGIIMNAAGVAIPFSSIQLTGEQLSFRMDPGEEVDCLLESGEGGVFKGQCRSVVDPDSEQLIRIFMRPPVVAEQPAADSGSVSPPSDASETEATAPGGSEAAPETDAEPPQTDAEPATGQPS